MAGWLRNVLIGVLFGVVLGFCLGSVRGAKARDVGQWNENTDTAVREWYKGLMQPDNPGVSCCSFADAYYADEVHIRDGKTFATVTDDREDGPLGRPHIPIGTEFEIPDQKLKWDRGNPTSHNVLFVSSTGHTFCFVQSSGS